MKWARWGCVVAAVHLVLWTVPTWAERKDSYADKIEQEKKTLEKLRGTIVEKRKKADEAEKKRESVLQGLQSLDERLVRHRQEHQDVVKKLKKKDVEIEQMSVQLSRLSERIDERQDAIAARLRASCAATSTVRSISTLGVPNIELTRPRSTLRWASSTRWLSTK